MSRPWGSTIANVLLWLPPACGFHINFSLYYLNCYNAFNMYNVLSQLLFIIMLNITCTFTHEWVQHHTTKWFVNLALGLLFLGYPWAICGWLNYLKYLFPYDTGHLARFTGSEVLYNIMQMMLYGVMYYVLHWCLTLWPSKGICLFPIFQPSIKHPLIQFENCPSYDDKYPRFI